MASGGVPPLEILGITKGMTIKFLPDVGIHKEAPNQEKHFDIICLVCKLQSKIKKNLKFLEMQLLGMPTLQNFAG